MRYFTSSIQTKRNSAFSTKVIKIGILSEDENQMTIKCSKSNNPYWNEHYGRGTFTFDKKKDEIRWMGKYFAVCVEAGVFVFAPANDPETRKDALIREQERKTKKNAKKYTDYIID